MSAVKIYQAYDDIISRELPIKAVSLDEATLATGHGVYAVFRLYPGMKTLSLGAHLERMRRSAALLGEAYPLTDEWLRARLRQAVTASGFLMSRIRLTVPYAAPNTAFIAVEPFTPPTAEVFERGVEVGLAHAHRDQPLAKDSRFVERRDALKTEGGASAYEVLLAGEDGSILEGMSSNFYAVKDDVLRTAGEGILEGIARKLILDVAVEMLPVDLTPVSVDDVPFLTEAFLSSSSRGPVPIVKISGQGVGAGRPGAIFKAIKAAYDQRVEDALEDL